MTSAPFSCWYFLLLKLRILKPSGDGYSLLCSKKQPPRHNTLIYRIVSPMDKGTLKTPIPSCPLHLSFCLGWFSNLVGSESGQKQSVKFLQNMVCSTIQSPPPQIHTVCILYTVQCTCSLGRGEGGRRSERRYSRGATVHKYSSFVHGGNSSQAASKIQTNQWMYLQSMKSVKQNAAKSVNRSTERKADI